MTIILLGLVSFVLQILALLLVMGGSSLLVKPGEDVKSSETSAMVAVFFGVLFTVVSMVSMWLSGSLWQGS